MADCELRSERRTLSAADRERYARLAAEVERAFPPGLAPPAASESAIVTTLGEYVRLRAVAADLRRLREQRGIDLHGLAETTGFSADRLRRIEEGVDLDPPLSLLSRYARAVRKRVSFVVGDDEPEPVRPRGAP